MLDDDAVPNNGINDGGGSSTPQGLANVNGTLFFQANDFIAGAELWKTNGSNGPGNTVMVDDDLVPDGGINSNGVGGDQPSDPAGITDVNGVAYFGASNGDDGFELWRSNGNNGPGNTEMVEDPVPGGGIRNGAGTSSFAGGMTNVSGTIFFSAIGDSGGEELWKTDGTPAGTTIVEDGAPDGGLNPTGAMGSNSSNPFELTNIGGTLFFNADDGTNGRELWKSNAAGTSMVEDGVPGSGLNNGGDSTPAGFTAFAGGVFFRATDGVVGTELWRAQVEGPPAPPGGDSTPALLLPAASTPTSPAKKKCKKGRKLKKGKCVRKKKKK